jgi:deazaflavin-dependent oxidoreductase (nitroreductase family)
MVRWITRLVAPLVHVVDRQLLSWSGDRLCLTAPLTGLPVLRITTTGARSGRPRTHPLTVLREGERIALVGSNFGRGRMPSWYHNLRANPHALVHGLASTTACEARAATPAEYERIWSRAVELYPGYAAYARRAAPRRVPIFVLTPIDRG